MLTWILTDIQEFCVGGTNTRTLDTGYYMEEYRPRASIAGVSRSCLWFVPNLLSMKFYLIGSDQIYMAVDTPMPRRQYMMRNSTRRN